MIPEQPQPHDDEIDSYRDRVDAIPERRAMAHAYDGLDPSYITIGERSLMRDLEAALDEIQRLRAAIQGAMHRSSDCPTSRCRMPVDWSRYPANWSEIRARILVRATGPDGVSRCERCGVPDRAVIQRAGERWQELGMMEAERAALDGERVTLVVLTIAHLGTPHADGRPGDKHGKHDCRDENLLALCQRGHLREDIDDHVRNAARTRRRRRIEAGQLPLPSVVNGEAHA